MKIFFLSYWFLPNIIGGSELVTYHFARAMTEKGHECHVITQLDSRDFPTYEIMEGIHVHRLKRLKINFVGTLLYGLKVLRLVRRIRPDIVHEQAIQGLSPIIRRFYKVPYLVFPRSTEFYLESNFYQRLIAMITLKNADILLGQTGNIAHEMQRLSGKDVIVMPNGVELKRFACLSKMAARRKLGIRDNENILLCVASVRRIKGHRYLIQAVEAVVKSYPNVRLFLVGKDYHDGSMPRPALERLKYHIVLTGQIPPEEIPDYMAAADIFVLPSLSEGVPNVLLEAMAAGLPIVASSVGGIPELITDGENGFLVEPGNSEGLAAKILTLLENKELREKISRNNLEESKRYNWPAVIDSLEKVYLETNRR